MSTLKYSVILAVSYTYIFEAFSVVYLRSRWIHLDSRLSWVVRSICPLFLIWSAAGQGYLRRMFPWSLSTHWRRDCSGSDSMGPLGNLAWWFPWWMGWWSAAERSVTAPVFHPCLPLPVFPILETMYSNNRHIFRLLIRISSTMSNVFKQTDRMSIKYTEKGCKIVLFSQSYETTQHFGITHVVI